MKLCHRKDESETSTRADRQNASDIRTLVRLVSFFIAGNWFGLTSSQRRRHWKTFHRKSSFYQSLTWLLFLVFGFVLPPLSPFSSPSSFIFLFCLYFFFCFFLFNSFFSFFLLPPSSLSFSQCHSSNIICGHFLLRSCPVSKLIDDF